MPINLKISSQPIFYLSIVALAGVLLLPANAIAQPPFMKGIPDSSKLKAPGPKIDKKILEDRAFDPSEVLCTGDEIADRIWSSVYDSSVTPYFLSGIREIIEYAETARTPYDPHGNCGGDCAINDLTRQWRERLLRCAVRSNFDDEGRRLFQPDVNEREACVRESLFSDSVSQSGGAPVRMLHDATHSMTTPSCPECDADVDVNKARFWLRALYITHIFDHFCQRRMDPK